MEAPLSLFPSPTITRSHFPIGRCLGSRGQIKSLFPPVRPAFLFFYKRASSCLLFFKPCLRGFGFKLFWELSPLLHKKGVSFPFTGFVEGGNAPRFHFLSPVPALLPFHNAVVGRVVAFVFNSPSFPFVHKVPFQPFLICFASSSLRPTLHLLFQAVNLVAPMLGTSSLFRVFPLLENCFQAPDPFHDATTVACLKQWLPLQLKVQAVPPLSSDLFPFTFLHTGRFSC